MNHNLLPGIKLLRLEDQVAAGTDGAFATLPEIDMIGYSGAMIVFQLGAIAASGVITTRVKGSNTSASYGSGTVGMLGSALANNADTDDNKFIVHDISESLYRYMQVEYQRTGGNVTIDAVFVILYRNQETLNPYGGSAVEAYQVLNGPAASTS